jgi:riboflavin kinase/FMN adenylyltransferase
MSRLFRSVEGGELFPNGSVVCIGAFDGLHLGHRALVRHAVARARALGVAAVAVAFEPLPREFFAQGTPPPRLTLARSKVEILHELAVDAIGLLRFDAAMAAMPAETFVRQLLAQRLNAREVWIGPEFCFGNRRRGDLALLQALGAELGFSAGEIEAVDLHGDRISSTRIRQLLQEGDFARVGDLLGRPYSISGRVVRGRQLGRTLGFPTANLRFPKTPALSGIYATWVHGVFDQPWPSVSSFGTRPTVDGVEPLLEAHLFDFQGDLYGRHIEVEFVAKLRDEEKFNDLAALTDQMHRDAEQARAILSEHRLRATARARTTSPPSTCRPPNSRCAATCPSASRAFWRAGKSRGSTSSCATTPPAARCSCCMTARRTPMRASTWAMRSTRSSRTSSSSRATWPASMRPMYRAGTAMACRSKSRWKRSGARSG